MFAKQLIDLHRRTVPAARSTYCPANIACAILYARRAFIQQTIRARTASQNFMRRNFSLIGITCALILSGWGGALAAALCPHAQRGVPSSIASTPDMRPDDAHACCRMSKKSASVDGNEAYCSGTTENRNVASTHNEASSHQKAVPHHEASRPAHGTVGTEPETHEAAARFAVESSTCDHCVERREQLPAFVRARSSGEAKPDILTSAVHAQKVSRAVVPSFSPITPLSRGAPPGRARRHVLISVFLI